MAPPGSGEASGAVRACAYHRTLRSARTIADLAWSEKIALQHLSEALQYRPRMSDG